MNILVIGGGGREHTIVKQLKKSSKVKKIYCAPGNAGIAADAVCIPEISALDIPAVVGWASQNPVDLVFVAPDDPLAAGMVDALENAGIAAFGPSRLAAEIEGSKVFSKDLMKKYSIPTAEYEVFENPDDAVKYISSSGKYPVVIKADGLALGKGVIIAENEEQAQKAVHEIMQDKIFGDSGNRVVVEEFLTGPEVSVLAFTDGKTVVPMVSSKDHKRAFDGDKGPNTGGMGTISPNPHYTEDIAKTCMETIFQPTVDAMAKEGRPFKGVLYFGLMLTGDGVKVIEYNARFGDPEAQVVLPRLKTDFLDILEAVMEERLSEIDIQWSDEACACVIMASGGYPGSYPKGVVINGLDDNGQVENAVVYHAATVYEDSQFKTNGGRVLGVTGIAENLEDALKCAYDAVDKISFDGAMYRKDIGR